MAANQYVALGTIFEDCGGGDIAVKDVVRVGAPVGSGSIGNSDQIWRWDTASSTWTKYYYYSSRGVTRWVVSTNNKEETADTIPAGETFFFLRAPGSATTDLTLAGQVKAATGSKSFTVAANQLAFASNPWPTALTIKDFNNYYASGSPVGSGSIGNSDQIWLWNTSTSTWTKYYFYSSRGVTRWVVSTNNKEETSDTIPVGVGFFFQRAPGSAPATVTFEQ